MMKSELMVHCLLLSIICGQSICLCLGNSLGLWFAEKPMPCSLQQSFPKLQLENEWNALTWRYSLQMFTDVYWITFKYKFPKRKTYIHPQTAGNMAPSFRSSAPFFGAPHCTLPKGVYCTQAIFLRLRWSFTLTTVNSIWYQTTTNKKMIMANHCKPSDHSWWLTSTWLIKY